MGDIEGNVMYNTNVWVLHPAGTLLTSSELKTRFGRAAGKSTMPQLAQIKAYHREHPEAQGSP